MKPLTKIFLLCTVLSLTACQATSDLPQDTQTNDSIGNFDPCANVPDEQKAIIAHMDNDAILAHVVNTHHMDTPDTLSTAYENIPYNTMKSTFLFLIKQSTDTIKQAHPLGGFNKVSVDRNTQYYDPNNPQNTVKTTSARDLSIDQLYNQQSPEASLFRSLFYQEKCPGALPENFQMTVINYDINDQDGPNLSVRYTQMSDIHPDTIIAVDTIAYPNRRDVTVLRMAFGYNPELQNSRYLHVAGTNKKFNLVSVFGISTQKGFSSDGRISVTLNPEEIAYPFMTLSSLLDSDGQVDTILGGAGTIDEKHLQIMQKIFNDLDFTCTNLLELNP